MGWGVIKAQEDGFEVFVEGTDWEDRSMNGSG